MLIREAFAGLFPAEKTELTGFLMERDLSTLHICRIRGKESKLISKIIRKCIYISNASRF